MLNIFEFSFCLSLSSSPGYKTLLLFVRNQAQALINQRRTFFSSISPTKKQAAFFEQSTIGDHSSILSQNKRNRTSSETNTNQALSSLESLTINTQLPKNGTHSDTSPTIRPRRFSGDIVLPSTSTDEPIEPSLFSPGSVRARTVTSAQETKTAASSSIAHRQNSLSNSSTTDSSAQPKHLDIRLSSGKTVHTSDFIHSNPHVENVPNQLNNDTARNKLLQSVFINNTNSSTSSSSPLSESLTNGTNSHTQTVESSSNCVLS